MSKVKCIVHIKWAERGASNEKFDTYVTNEDGTPRVFESLTEARAHIAVEHGFKFNGYEFGTTVWARPGVDRTIFIRIIREDSREYAEIITAAATEEPEQTTAEIIAEQARDLYHDTIYSTVTANDIEQADAYTNEHLSLTVEVMDALGIFHASNRMLVAIAQAMRWTLEDLEAQAIEEAHDRAAAALINAYADAIGDAVTEDDPEAIAAHRVARACIGLATATDDDRATVSAMVEAIADKAREAAALARYQTTDAAHAAARAEEAAQRAETAAADPEDLEEPAPIYQRYELEAYLGDPDAYDVDAIEAEATRYTADGARVWAAFGDDLAAICERHELVTYYAI